MNRVAGVLGVDPFELRLKNASRVGDTTPNRVVLHDPSSVAVIQALAGEAGVTLPAGSRTMTNAPRTGDLLPPWLVDQQVVNGGSH
jgi:CO/xanthine dehydrogenase Mo-binding subunit